MRCAGVARDLAAAGLGSLKPLPETLKNPGTFQSPIQVHLEAGPDAPYFSGRFIRGIQNRESPLWLQKRLLSIGLRPLSALVDITNYLCHDLGRPLHVFDANKIHGDIRVRKAVEGESFEALTSKTYLLDSEKVVIADDKDVLALGGIVGGLSSSCTLETQNVFLESALFDAICISKAGQQLGVLSDARARFERGVDPEMTLTGLELATALILELCAPEGNKTPEVSFVVAVGTLPPPHPSLQLTPKELARLTGCDIPLSKAASWLKSLGFEIVSETPTMLDVRPPSWRVDCLGPEDLVEEVLRLEGYDRIPMTPLPPEPLCGEEGQASSLALQEFLAMRGLQETVTYSFISEDLAHTFSEKEGISLLNPLSRATAVMRPTVIASLLEAAALNAARGANPRRVLRDGGSIPMGRLSI